MAGLSQQLISPLQAYSRDPISLTIPQGRTLTHQHHRWKSFPIHFLAKSMVWHCWVLSFPKCPAVSKWTIIRAMLHISEELGWDRLMCPGSGKYWQSAGAGPLPSTSQTVLLSQFISNLIPSSLGYISLQCFSPENLLQQTIHYKVLSRG